VLLPEPAFLAEAGLAWGAATGFSGRRHGLLVFKAWTIELNTLIFS
jgi:hypothetical protein